MESVLIKGGGGVEVKGPKNVPEVSFEKLAPMNRYIYIRPAKEVQMSQIKWSPVSSWLIILPLFSWHITTY